MNKKPTHNSTSREQQFKNNSRKTKTRLDSFDQIKLADKQAMDFYDKVKIYPKTNQEQAMKKVNRDYQRQKTFHIKD